MSRTRALHRGHNVTPKTHPSHIHKRGIKVTVSKTNSDTSILKTVEQAIKRSNIYPTKFALWKNMPVKISYQQFMQIVKQLERENKLVLDKNLIVWTLVDSPQARRSLEQSVRLN